MNLTLTLTLVVAFSFAVSRLLGRYAPRSVYAGAPYLVVGVLVGPRATALVSDQDLQVLQPFVSLTLGVLGFVLGLPLARQLKSIPVLEAGLIAMVLTMSVVAAGSLGVLELAEFQHGALAALTLGAAAAATSLPTLRSAAQRFGASGLVTNLVQSFALVGNVGAVLLAGMTLAWAGSTESAARLGLGEAEWLVASVALGVACGLLFHFFVRAEASEERVFLATVGIIVFASGMASGIGISPLVLNALAGVTVALAAGRERDLAKSLERLERPAVIVLMIFAGAMARPDALPTVIAPVAFFAVRYVTLRFASGVAVRTISRVEVIPRLGDGLLPLGGIAVAIAVNYAQVDLTYGQLVLAAVLGASLLTELLAQSVLRRLWIDAGEIRELAPPLESKVR